MSEAYHRGSDVAHALYLKLGAELSAPINFMVSRPYFRYLEQLQPEHRADFAVGYRETWKAKHERTK